MKKLLISLQIILITVLVVLSVLFFIMWKNNGFSMESFYTHETELSTIVLQHELEDIGELATEKYFFSEMQSREDSVSFLDIDGWDMPWTRNNMVITFEGCVLAGIKDFSEIEIEINDKDNSIMVILPEVEILSVDIDHDSVEIYDIDDNIFNPIPVDAQVEMLAEAEDDIIDDALDDGILEKAKSRLEDLIGSLIRSMIENSKYSDYKIVYKWRG